MAGMHEEAKSEKPAAAQPKAGLELDDDDNVADYMEVCSIFPVPFKILHIVCRSDIILHPVIDTRLSW